MRRLVTRFTRRYARRPLVKPNLPYFVWRFIGNGVRTYRALITRPTHTDTVAIAHELVRQGIVVGTSDMFLTDAGRREFSAGAAKILEASRSESVQAIVAGTAPAKNKKSFRVDLMRQGIAADDSWLKVALDPRLLEIVAAYLGMWPSLHSVSAWLNYATDTPATSSQLWHHDPEDLKLIKVFAYLADVGDENGPFTYIPGTHPFGANVAKAQQHKKKERLTDDQLSDVFPPSTWRVCTGPARTMILADTVGYHRGGKPTRGTRVLATFTYTSGTSLATPAIWLKGTPDWISLPIQRFAVKRLGSSPPVKAATHHQ